MPSEKITIGLPAQVAALGRGMIGLLLLAGLFGCTAAGGGAGQDGQPSKPRLGAVERFHLEFGYAWSPPEPLLESWYQSHTDLPPAEARRFALDETYPNLATVPPRPAGVQKLERQRFLDSVTSDYRELWQSQAQNRQPAWSQFRATPDSPAASEPVISSPKSPVASRDSSARPEIQRAPPLDLQDREIQKQLMQQNLLKLAKVYFAPKVTSCNQETLAVLTKVAAYVKAQPYRLRIEGGGKLANERLAQIRLALIKAGVTPRLITLQITPKGSDEDLFEIYSY